MRSIALLAAAAVVAGCSADASDSARSSQTEGEASDVAAQALVRGAVTLYRTCLRPRRAS